HLPSALRGRECQYLEDASERQRHAYRAHRSEQGFETADSGKAQVDARLNRRNGHHPTGPLFQHALQRGGELTEIAVEPDEQVTLERRLLQAIDERAIACGLDRSESGGP